MRLIPLQPTQHSLLRSETDVTIKQFDIWRYSVPLHIGGSFSNGVAEDVRKNAPNRGELIKRRKLSSLKGKVTKMTTEEIDKQLKSLRNEWQRDI